MCVPPVARTQAYAEFMASTYGLTNARACDCAECRRKADEARAAADAADAAERERRDAARPLELLRAKLAVAESEQAAAARLAVSKTSSAGAMTRLAETLDNIAREAETGALTREVAQVMVMRLMALVNSACAPRFDGGREVGDISAHSGLFNDAAAFLQRRVDTLRAGVDKLYAASQTPEALARKAAAEAAAARRAAAATAEAASGGSGHGGAAAATPASQATQLVRCAQLGGRARGCAFVRGLLSVCDVPQASSSIVDACQLLFRSAPLPRRSCLPPLRSPSLPQPRRRCR